MDRSSRLRSRIEPLEDRIAPALLINGANLLGGSSPSTGETSVGGNSVTVVKVISGQAIVWFEDGHIEGISFANNTSLVITGNVQYDIVGNLMPNGRLSDTDHNPLNGEDGGILLPNNLIGLKVLPLTPEDGSIIGHLDSSTNTYFGGNIITAGSVSNVSVNGQISGIYAGDGAFSPNSRIYHNGVVTSYLGGLDFNPIAAGIQSQFVFKPSDAASINPSFGLTGMQAGASIHDISVNKAFQLQAIAGSGNPNNLDFSGKTAPSGGSIFNFTIQSASYNVNSGTPLPSYQLIAGDAGSGAKGGVGGSIQNITEINSSGSVVIQAGAGGVGSKGAGGAGGSIVNLNLQSSNTQYIVMAGNGGAGTPGGAGGSVTNNSYANTTPAGGVIASADFTGDGSGDVLIVDQGSGQMVIEKSNPNGTSTFSPLTQHTNSNNQPVILIDPAGQNPIAAAPAYVTQAGLGPDFVVAYQGSNSIVAYENQGGGHFWDSSLNGGAGGYKTDVASLSFSPSKMALVDSSADEIVLAENTNGGSKIHLVTKIVTTTGFSFQEATGSLSLPLPCTSLVTTADGTVFASTSDGTIYRLTVTNGPGNPFTNLSVANVAGGISQLDVDSTGTELLALGNGGKTLAVYNESGGNLNAAATINLSNLNVKPSVAHFVPGAHADKIAVLGSAPGGSGVEIYDPNEVNQVVVGYTPEKLITSDRALLNFAVATVGSGGSLIPGIAALQTSLGQFSFDSNFGPAFTQYALPFAAKTVTVSAGNGGDGVDLGAKLGKGGAGGSILGVNVDASIVQIGTGNGGNSQSGPAGAGGSFINPASMTISKGVSVNPTVSADSSLVIYAGHGGSPTVAGGSAASGGAGGSLSGLSLVLNVGQNDLDLGLSAGYGGNGLGGNGGAGGGILNVNAVGHDGGLTLQSGDGGQAKAGATTSLGNGGAAGSISGVSYALTLDANVASVEKAHSATIVTGSGGSAISGTGGAGGTLQNLTLNMQGANRTYDDSSATPNLVDAHLDSTVTIGVQLGSGGDGGKGGNGGGMSGFVYNQTLLQTGHDNGFITNYTVMSLVAGNGGHGTTGAGGNGGGISLTKPITGVTSYDPDATTPGNNPNRIPLIVTAGAGGDGATTGGVGGSISGLLAQNSLLGTGNNISVMNTTLLVGAQVTAGKGGAGTSGNGGSGGSVTGSTLGVQATDLNYLDALPPDYEGGMLIVTAGDGGQGGVAGTSAAKAKGGAGGSVTGGQFGLVSTVMNVGMLIGAGSGGDGIAGGGTGGGLASLSLNMSQSTVGLSALLFAGDGGAADSAAGTGGKGGAVTNIVELKDTNSSINLIQAGNGGDNPLGKGGAGGNVSQIHTVGFIGRPSDTSGALGVFDQISLGDYIPQGLFSGRGGAGATNGVAGSIVNVIARQIAAMSAAEDPTAEANGTKGTFAPASKIANVTADLIGFDVGGDGAYTDSLGAHASPSSAVPLDGFVLASVIQNVKGPRTGFEFSA